MSNDLGRLSSNVKSHADNSSYREKLVEHLFVAELLKLSRLHHGCTLETAKPEVDNAGYDIIAETPGCVRHIQLKTTFRGGKAASQKVHAKLANKPSGCVLWIYFDKLTLNLGPFRFLGLEAGKPLLSLSQYKIAKHTKGNRDGFKAARPNVRVIPKRDFKFITSIEEIFSELFQIKSEKLPESPKCSDSTALLSTNSIAHLPIKLIPSDSSAFRAKLLRSGMAIIEITYANGSTEEKRWNVRRLSNSSNIKGNLRSRHEFRRGKWQARGIARIVVRVSPAKY